MTWIDDVRAAAPGDELLGFLARRLSTPETEGPRLDDRRGEGPEDVFLTLAASEGSFRERLEQTIAAYFPSDAASPVSDEARPVVLGLLEIVGLLSLDGCASAVRGWLARHEPALVDDPNAVLGRAALGALATTLRRTDDARAFWLRCWREAPTPWQPRAFIGLRLNDPRTAALEIPELIRRTENELHGPRALLLGMWKQEPDGRAALIEWLRANAAWDIADRVNRDLRDLVTPQERHLLPDLTPKCRLPSLALDASVLRPWKQPPTDAPPPAAPHGP